MLSRKYFESSMREDHPNTNEWFKTWNISTRDYKHLPTSWAWRMWQKAIKQVQSKFVLLPVDTAQEALNWAIEAKWNSSDVKTDAQIKKHLSVIKRAIKAQEQVG